MSDGDTPESSALRESVTRFTKSEIAQYLAPWEVDLKLPRELDQKAAYAGLPGVGFSEDVGGGSNVAGNTTSARRDGEDFIVNGAKTFITSGIRADFVTTAVRTGGEGAGGISLLAIDKDSPGCAVASPLKKMGWDCSGTAELNFADVRVPARSSTRQAVEKAADLAANPGEQASATDGILDVELATNTAVEA